MKMDHKIEETLLRKETFAIATQWEIECPFCGEVHEVDELPSEIDDKEDRPLICPCGSKTYMYISQEGDALSFKTEMSF